MSDWDLTPKEAVARQRVLAAKVDVETPLGPVERIAAVDVSFNIRGDRVFAVIVVCDADTGEVLERKGVAEPPRFPYIPGLLSFREVPPLLAAYKLLRRKPDVIICDGQGYAHPRRIGIASHLGLLLKKPTVGCAKSVLVGAYAEPGKRRGSRSPMTHKDEVVGYAVRTRVGVKPVFVSPGHLVTFDDAVDLVLQTATKYRLPDPIREAHRFANQLRLEATSGVDLVQRQGIGDGQELR